MNCACLRVHSNGVMAYSQLFNSRDNEQAPNFPEKAKKKKAQHKRVHLEDHLQELSTFSGKEESANHNPL